MIPKSVEAELHLCNEVFDGLDLVPALSSSECQVVRTIEVKLIHSKSFQKLQIVLSAVLFLSLPTCGFTEQITPQSPPGQAPPADSSGSQRTPGSTAVVEGDPVEVFFTPNPSGHTDFARLVQKAGKSIDLAMFRITDMDDANALIEAVKRKVRVRVLVDKSMLEANKNTAVPEALKAGGVELKPSSKAFTITHEKSMVVDGEFAMISTINLTNAYKTTRGLGVVTHDTEVVSEFENVFETDWQNADRDTKDTPTLSSAKLLWSPVNSVEKLVTLIQSAQASIEVYVENFTDPDIEKALEDAAGRGVKVRVLTPLCDENPNPFLNLPMMKKLAAQHVDARLMKGPSTATNPYIHAKAMLIDRSRAYVGSMNFSYNSLHNAREVGILFSNPQAVSQIEEKYDEDWSLAIAPPESTDGICPNHIETFQKPTGT